MSIVTQLIDLEITRAFPNQFEITVASDTDDNLAKNFTFYATKISLGNYAVEAERILSTQQTIIKKATIPDTLSLTVKETDDWNTLKYFYNWYTSAYYNPSSNLFRTGLEGKRKTFYIYALSPPYTMTSVNAQKNPQSYRFKITLNDALLVGSIALPTFDYKAFEPVEHTFTIQSDDIALNWGSGSEYVASSTGNASRYRAAEAL